MKTKKKLQQENGLLKMHSLHSPINGLREKSLVYIEMDFKLMLKYIVKLLEMFIEATSAN